MPRAKRSDAVVDIDWHELHELRNNPPIGHTGRWTWDDVLAHTGLNVKRETLKKWYYNQPEYEEWKEAQQAKENLTPEEPEYKEQENRLQIHLVTEERITSIEQLLKIGGYDPDEWEIAKKTYRKYESFARNRYKRMTSKGHEKYGLEVEDGVVIVELFYVAVDLVKKKPIPVQPIPQSVKITLEPKPYTFEHSDNDFWVLDLPDPHFGYNDYGPYHNDRALDIAFQFAYAYREFIRYVIWGGDVVDLEELSTFIKIPSGVNSFQLALNDSAARIAELKNILSEATHVVLEGNHDARLIKALIQRMPELYGLKKAQYNIKWPVISIPFLLSLEEMGVEYIEAWPRGTGEYWIGDCAWIHGTKIGAQGLAVSKYLRDAKTSHDVVAHHDHRTAVASTTVWGARSSRNVITTMIPGCLCNVEGNIPPARNGKQDWQQAIGLSIFGKKDIVHHFLPITDEGLRFGGLLVK